MIEDGVTFCDACHRELLFGEWPFCPHGFKATHGGVIGDECDVVQENGFAHPTRFTSKRELKKALDARGLEMRVRHVPIPGTDKSPHTSDWSKGSMDPYTMAAAEALVARAGLSSATTETPTVASTWTITVRE